jgi:hypothetical protein
MSPFARNLNLWVIPIVAAGSPVGVIEQFMNNQRLQRDCVPVEEATISILWRVVAIVLLALWTIGCTNQRSELLRS